MQRAYVAGSLAFGLTSRSMPSSREIIRKLEADGWTLDRQRGSHCQLIHRDRPGIVTVPHPVKDLTLGTLRSIYRQAGWRWPKDPAMATYVALIDGEAGRLGVTFPDLPGCVTMGATEHEALVKAGEALAFHIDGLRRHGLPVPTPRSLDALRQGQEHAEDFAGAKAVALVSAGETADPAVADAAV